MTTVSPQPNLEIKQGEIYWVRATDIDVETLMSRGRSRRKTGLM
jgi:hypothetical protein